MRLARLEQVACIGANRVAVQVCLACLGELPGTRGRRAHHVEPLVVNLGDLNLAVLLGIAHLCLGKLFLVALHVADGTMVFQDFAQLDRRVHGAIVLEDGGHDGIQFLAELRLAASLQHRHQNALVARHGAKGIRHSCNAVQVLRHIDVLHLRSSPCISRIAKEQAGCIPALP